MRSLDLLPGTLDMLVLQVLCQGQRHGYEVARLINEYSRGRFRIIDGALYAALHRLEARGWVSAEWGHTTTSKRAKFYALTTAGRRAFRKEATNWSRYVAGVSQVMVASARGREIDRARPPHTKARGRGRVADLQSR